MTNTVIIYRIERADGSGPFGNGLSTTYDDHKRAGVASCYDPPAPYDNRERGSDLHAHAKRQGITGWHFGFTSKAQIRRWFRSKKGRRAMAEVGGVLSVYEVPSRWLIRGYEQVIFKRSKASRVGFLNLETLEVLQ